MFVMHPVRRDRNYTVTIEHTGRETPEYVVRYCGEFIGSRRFLSSATALAVGDHAHRRGALTFVEVR